MTIEGSSQSLRGDEENTDDDTSDDDERLPKSGSCKRISFPADSILNAVIQDGDVMELLHILQFRGSEIDVNQRNHTGLTALHYAVLTNNLDSVKLLINHGANVCSQDEYGFSPLHTAAALGYLQVTSLLIIHGADVFSLTNHNELPIDLAKDISVIRVLYSEMYVKYHIEQYYRTMLLLAIRNLSWVVKKVLLYIIHILELSVKYVFKTVVLLKAKYFRPELRTTFNVNESMSECKTVEAYITDNHSKDLKID